MKKHKGQVIVEFALILPLFLLVMYGIIYSGMMFHDYSTLSNIARASAREAAISAEDPTGSGNRYTGIENRYKDMLNLMTSFYKKDSSNPIVIEQVIDEQGNKSVRSTINVTLDVHGYFVDRIMPPTFGVKYYMRQEPTDSSSTP